MQFAPTGAGLPDQAGKITKGVTDEVSNAKTTDVLSLIHCAFYVGSRAPKVNFGKGGEQLSLPYRIPRG